MSSTTPSEIPAPPPPAVTRGGYGTTALVLGLVAIAALSTGVLIPLALAAGLLAIVFGVRGRRRARDGETGDGLQSLSGLILGAIAFGLSVTAIVVFLTLGVGRFGFGFGGPRGFDEGRWERWEQDGRDWWHDGDTRDDEGADAPAEAPAD